MSAFFRRLRSDSLPPVSHLGLMTKVKLLRLIRRTWSLRSNGFACLQSGRVSSPLTGGSVWLSPLFPWAGSEQWTSFNILPDAFLFYIAVVVSSAGSYSPHPLLSLGCMDGLDVVSSSNALVLSSIFRFQLACDRLELPLHAGGTGGQGVLCTYSRRGVRRSSGLSFAMHGTKVSLWSSPFCPSWVVLSGPCLLCNIVWPFRRVFIIFLGVYSEVLDRNPKDVFAPRSALVAELLITILLVPLAGVHLRPPPPPSPASLGSSLQRRVACGSGDGSRGFCSRHWSAGAVFS